MSTILDKPLKRELHLGDEVYTLTITPLGVRIVPKGRRNGQEVSWEDILNGGVELKADLARSLAAGNAPPKGRS